MEEREFSFDNSARGRWRARLLHTQLNSKLEESVMLSGGEPSQPCSSRGHIFICFQKVSPCVLFHKEIKRAMLLKSSVELGMLRKWESMYCKICLGLCRRESESSLGPDRGRISFTSELMTQLISHVTEKGNSLTVS